MANNIHELIPFNTACEDFVAGRYILAEVKVGSILKALDEDEKLKDIVSSALDNFDFNKEFSLAVKQNENSKELVLPTDEKKVIAFVYCLLFNFHNGNLKFYDFLNQFYKVEGDVAGKEFSNFAAAVIIPFRDCVNTAYNKRHVLVETEDYQNNYYNKILSTVKLIMNNLDSYKLKMNEKEEFSMLLNSLYFASEKNDKKLVFSLMIALDYFTRCNKKCRVAYLTLEECFTN